MSGMAIDAPAWNTAADYSAVHRISDWASDHMLCGIVSRTCFRASVDYRNYVSCWKCRKMQENIDAP